MTSALLSSLMVFMLLTAQLPSGGETARDMNAQRLELMKESVNTYQLIRGGDQGRALKLQPDPAFRLGRQGNGGILEGAIFLWTDEVGRPEAAAQVFLHRYAGRPDGEWIHEFTSLSLETFTANQNGAPQWRPSEPGLMLKPLPGAPKPAAQQAQRLRQMRTLAEEFRAHDNFGDGGWEVLRLLPTPITRYGKPGGAPVDGALYAFVEGTDPEVFLFLECARMTAGFLGNTPWLRCRAGPSRSRPRASRLEFAEACNRRPVQTVFRSYLPALAVFGYGVESDPKK